MSIGRVTDSGSKRRRLKMSIDAWAVLAALLAALFVRIGVLKGIPW